MLPARGRNAFYSDKMNASIALMPRFSTHDLGNLKNNFSPPYKGSDKPQRG